MSPSIAYDPVADRYEESRGGMARAEALADAVAAVLPRTSPVLDVGAGTGIVTECMARRGWELLALDLSAGMLARACSRVPGRLVRGDACGLPIATAGVANVVFCWSLHLVGDPAAAVREARRVVRPGGRVVIASSAQEGPDDEIHAIVRRLDALASVERSRPQVDLLRNAAQSAGLVHVGESWAEQTVDETPAHTAERILSRDYNMLWDIDEETWRSSVVPIIDALRSLPEPDRPRRRVFRHRVMAFSAP